MPVTASTQRLTPTHKLAKNVAVHKISFRGLGGAIFALLGTAVVLYFAGFSTNGWSIKHDHHKHIGLWQACYVSPLEEPVEDWHRATQAMITIGLIGLIAAFVLVCIYMCVHSISKNATIIALTVICFVSVLFMLIGFIIWGVKTSNQNFSFALAVIAAIMTLVAGVLSVLQMRDAGVRM